MRLQLHQLQLAHAAQAQAQAGGRAGGYNINWQQMAMGNMGRMAFQPNGQPLPIHTPAVAQAKAAQAQPQPQGAGAR